MDEIRREIWNEARRAANKQLAKDLKGARFALWKNPGNLSERQQLKLASIQQTNQRLYCAYLLAQQLRQIYRVGAQDGLALLESWLKWAGRSSPGAVPKARAPNHRTARTRRGSVHKRALKSVGSV